MTPDETTDPGNNIYWAGENPKCAKITSPIIPPYRSCSWVDLTRGAFYTYSMGFMAETRDILGAVRLFWCVFIPVLDFIRHVLDDFPVFGALSPP